MAELEDKVSARLKAVMEHCDIVGHKALADVCGTTSSAVNNWLAGYNLPRVPEMIRLCDQTGITLDWLYRGSLVAMDAKLGLKLGKIAKDPEKTALRTGRWGAKGKNVDSE